MTLTCFDLLVLKLNLVLASFVESRMNTNHIFVVFRTSVFEMEYYMQLLLRLYKCAMLRMNYLSIYVSGVRCMFHGGW